MWATAAGVVGMRFVPVVIDNFTSLGKAGGFAALVLLSAFQGTAWALGAAVKHQLEHRARFDPRVAFGAGVFVAISVPTVFGWTPAGLLSPWPALIQLAEIAGERGVSFLIAIVAACFAHPLLPEQLGRTGRRWVPALVGTAVLLALVVHGHFAMRSVRADLERRETMRIGVVQAAVPARLRWEPAERPRILAWLRAQTVAAEAAGAELTIWPEAAYPYVLEHRAGAGPRLGEAIVGGKVRGPVLAGLITRGDGDGRHNAATIVDRDGSMQRPQAKMELLWFGETVPLSGVFPVLRRVFHRTGALVPGEEVALLTASDARIAVLNCYEDTLPTIGRRVARERPNLLVNVTNDAWFGRTAEPELHLRLSALRAVEARLDLVRAVNLGVPAWIDATGTVRARGPDTERGILMVDAAIAEASVEPTLYVSVGDAPIWIGLVLSALGSLLLGLRSHARERSRARAA